MSQQGVTPLSEDFSQWYTDVVQRADLADYAPVRGCMIIKPYGYELWEGIRDALDKRFKATGHKNAYFPLFIPESFFKREAEHVEGFAPELAVVTHGGGEKLEEPLVVRPTSETVILNAFSEWVQSYRDLPLLINQWANVVRWEKRTRLFLRTMEFLWQEGHTAHATEAEARAETMQMLDVYTDMAVNEAAIPVVKGRKSDQERFAGAEETYAIEAMMMNKWALQSGTSHYFGQRFAKAFEIKFLDENNDLQYAYTTSWGLSTRFVGAIIMAHGDDKGLRLPPRLAPIQVVIVPIFKADEERATVMPVVDRVWRELKDAGFRVHVDARDVTPGFKFNDWEMRGVPLRIEIGPKDVANGTVAFGRRDLPGKQGKSFEQQAGLVEKVRAALDAIHQSLYDQALAFRIANTHEVNSYDALKEVIEAGGWASMPFDGLKDTEERIKEETKAASRCFPLEQEPLPAGTKDPVSGRPAEKRAIFARAF